MLNEQVRALVADHGLIAVLQALMAHCADRMPQADKHDVSWGLGRSVLRDALKHLNQLLDVPGITEPLVAAPRSPVEAPPSSEGARAPSSRPSSPGLC
jgi:hypothetical protein